MGVAKTILESLLTTLLIASLSVAIVSLTFSIMLDKQTLIDLGEKEVNPFLEEQVEAALVQFTPEQSEIQFNIALQNCQSVQFHTLSTENGESIQIPCDKIESSSPENFKDLIKEEIIAAATEGTSESLEVASSKLVYFTIALWISAALSCLLILILILVEGRFPFKKLGAAGIIAGLPFILIIFSQQFIISQVKDELRQSVPPRFLEDILQSSLFQSVTKLINNLVIGMAAGFAMLFLAGLVLLLIGVFAYKKSKKPNAKQPPLEKMTIVNKSS